MKKRKINLKKVIIAISILAVLLISIFLIIKITKNNDSVINKPQIVDNINGYELREGATNYEINLFNELRTIKNSESINYEDYAVVISKLFLTSFFTLDNKLSKHDIGGKQYVYEPYREDFEKSAQSTVYSGVESNVYGDRKQELPVVNSVQVSNIETTSFTYNNKTDNEAFKLDLVIGYNKDLGYQNDVTLILIHNNDKLEVAKME